MDTKALVVIFLKPNKKDELNQTHLHFIEDYSSTIDSIFLMYRGDISL